MLYGYILEEKGLDGNLEQVWYKSKLIIRLKNYI